MEAPLLVTDIWKQIWRLLGFSSKGRLELACRGFCQVWQESGVCDMDKFKPSKAARRMTIYASKPLLAAYVRRVHQPEAMLPIACPWAAFFTKAINLTYIDLHDTSKEGILNLLVGPHCPPLRTVILHGHTNTYYESIALAVLGQLRPTLESLEILVRSVRNTPNAPRSLLDAIVATLGDSLIRLSIQLEDIRFVQGMKALKYLYVIIPEPVQAMFDLRKLEETVTFHRSVCPPGVGVNVAINDGDETRTLLSEAVEGPSFFPCIRQLVEVYGADPNTPAQTWARDDYKFPLERAISERHYEAAKELIQLGAKCWGIPSSPSSVFGATLVSWRSGNEWYPFAKWLFDEHWPTLAGSATASELLGFPVEDILFQLIRFVSVIILDDRVKFVTDRAHIFGKRSVHDLDRKGCNLSHHCQVRPDIEFIDSNDIDWRAKDHAGRDAIECSAAQMKDVTLELLMTWCTSDQDFIAHCTQVVFAACYGDKLTKLAERMMKLVHPACWPGLITACVQCNLRNSNGRVLHLLLAADNRDLDKVIWDAVFRPWRSFWFTDWFSNAQLQDRFPLPNHLNGTCLTRVIDQIPVYFTSDREALAWVNDPDEDGRTPEEIARSMATSESELNMDLKNLRRLVAAAEGCPVQIVPGLPEIPEPPL